MNKNPTLTLIIASASPLQDALLALMTTSSQISAVFLAEEASQALRMVNDHHPNLVLLDGNIRQAEMVLRQIKDQRPQTGCIALVTSVEQERAFTEADEVLVEGFSPARLSVTIEDLLAQPEVR